jgi:predicted SprT family Zn-dependent metalloprotease
MQEKINSEGKCLFCGETFAKADINKHLTVHLKEISKKGKAGQSFLVNVETNKRWGDTPYFLSLWVNGETTLTIIDDFLRDIWLECCGHMSAFTVPRNRKPKKKEMQAVYNSLIDENAENPNEISMTKKTKNVFCKGLELDYEYDFGSTTELTLTVIEEYPVKADKRLVLLSRNEPLQMICSICGEAPATQLCTACLYKGNAMFCDKCAKKHEKKCGEFADFGMPVVNSPRMGLCGYEGGSIDTERDGVYQQKI